MMCYVALKSNIDRGLSYYTTWSAVIVLLHLTPTVFMCTWIDFKGFFVYFSNSKTPFNILEHLN